MGMKHILLIDDSLIQLRILEVLLRDKYDIQMAISGMETSSSTSAGRQPENTRSA